MNLEIDPKNRTEINFRQNLAFRTEFNDIY